MSSDMKASGPGPVSGPAPSANPEASAEQSAKGAEALGEVLNQSHPGAEDSDPSEHGDNTSQN